MLRWSDARWLLAAPVYGVLNVTRHELSHALVALVQGVPVVKVSVLPTGFPGIADANWGYTKLGPVPLIPAWPISAAPFVCDLITFAIGLGVVRRLARSRRHWLWLNAVVMLLAGPFVDSVGAWVRYQYPQHDVGRLVASSPTP